MKTTVRITVIAVSLVFMLMADINLMFVELVPDADAIFGVRRRTARRTAVIVGSSVRSQDQAQISASQQQAAAAEAEATAAKQQAAAAEKEAATAKQQAAAATPPPPAAPGKPLPLGTVVSALPPGCVVTPVGGVEYYYGAGNFYRAVFQGNKLVYVTAKPE